MSIEGSLEFALALPMLAPEHFLPLAQAAESAGFASIAVPESVFFAEEVSADYPYTSDGGRFWVPETPFLDPFVAIPAMAAVTERVKFFTNVLKLGIRDPLLVAKTVSSIAAAGGRPHRPRSRSVVDPRGVQVARQGHAHPGCTHERSHRDHPPGAER
ncbi:MAG: LLM class flavin-dependent oxidoreductase [Microthrixaceae bacterium]